MFLLWCVVLGLVGSAQRTGRWTPPQCKVLQDQEHGSSFFFFLGALVCVSFPHFAESKWDSRPTPTNRQRNKILIVTGRGGGLTLACPFWAPVALLHFGTAPAWWRRKRNQHCWRPRTHSTRAPHHHPPPRPQPGRRPGRGDVGSGARNVGRGHSSGFLGGKPLIYFSSARTAFLRS